MATYKVLQDIEAEDKLLGPLTLRQFIYGAVAALCGYFCFVGVAKNLPFLLVPFLPVMLLFGFFAFPWGRDQPTEVWALAKVRFLLLPRKRIWDQSGAKDLVTITAPKKTNENFTNGLSQTEVKSRLLALADTLDSRGWATKNVSPASALATAASAPQSDRLVDLASMPQEVADSYAEPQLDILDDDNRTSANFSQMISSAEARHRQQLIDQMQSASQPQAPVAGQAAPPDNFWFLNQSGASSSPSSDAVITPGSEVAGDSSAPDEAALAEQLKANKKQPQVYNSHVKVIQPPSAASGASQAAVPNSQQTADNSLPITPPTSPSASKPISKASQPAKPYVTDDANAKIEQARRAAEQAQYSHNNDLSIATIARQVNKKPEGDEVVINLH